MRRWTVEEGVRRSHRWEILQACGSRDRGGLGREKETSQRKRRVFKDNVSRAEKKGAPKPDSEWPLQGAEVLTLESGDT